VGTWSVDQADAVVLAVASLGARKQSLCRYTAEGVMLIYILHYTLYFSERAGAG